MMKAGYNQSLWLLSRAAFAGSVGISDSYQAIADWNDQVSRRKLEDGTTLLVHKTKHEIVSALRRAADQLDKKLEPIPA
jgi:hypothetical protein